MIERNLRIAAVSRGILVTLEKGSAAKGTSKKKYWNLIFIVGSIVEI
jgi:hypothetical protein